MQYVINDISTNKFEINGFQMYKVFVPFKVNDTHVSILNVFDSKYALMPSTHVDDITLDEENYATADELITELISVIYAPQGGTANDAQIETNRQNIEALQGEVSDVNTLLGYYYTKNDVDEIINQINGLDYSYQSAEIDNNNLVFKNADDEVVLTVDVSKLVEQGSQLEDLGDGEIALKNKFGDVISQTSIKAKESFFDVFLFVDEIENDLSDFVPTQEFTLIKTFEENYFFVQKSDSEVQITDSRILINDIDTYDNLSSNPDFDEAEFKAWQLTLPESLFIVGTEYRFNFWKTATINDETTIETSTWSSDKISAELDEKVDASPGQGLSDENYTTDEKTKLAGIEEGAEVNLDASEVKTLYESNDDTNAFTDAEKSKLAGIETINATVLNQYTTSSAAGDAGTNLLQADFGSNVLTSDDMQVNSIYEGTIFGRIDNQQTGTNKTLELSLGAATFALIDDVNLASSEIFDVKIDLRLNFYNQSGDDVDVKINATIYLDDTTSFKVNSSTILNNVSEGLELVFTGHTDDIFHNDNTLISRC